MRRGLHATQQDEDARLLEACLAGDQQAWTDLVERYTRLIYSIVLKSGLNEHDTADVVQNVFTIVLRRLESLQQPDRFSAWLITTTHRECWRFAKSRREVNIEDGVEQTDPEPTADAQVVDWEHAALTHRALNQLGGQCQRLLELLFLSDTRADYKSIATDLGISIGSIGPTRARCLKRLKGHLAKLGIVDPNH